MADEPAAIASSPFQLQADAFQLIRVDASLLVDLHEAARLIIPASEGDERQSAQALCVALAGYWTRRHDERPRVGDLIRLLQGGMRLQSQLAAWSAEDLGDDWAALVLANRLRELAALDAAVFTTIQQACLQHLSAYGRAIYGDHPAPGPAGAAGA